MNLQLMQGTEKVASTLELSLIDAKELLELKDQKVKELQSILKDKESEILFLKEVLSARADLILDQNTTIDALQKRLESLKIKSDPPVIIMKTYLPGLAEEQMSETAI